MRNHWSFTIIMMSMIMMMFTAVAYSAEAVGQFEFTAIPVPTDTRVQKSVPSYNSQTISALCSPSGQFDDNWTLVQFGINDDSLDQLFCKPVPEYTKFNPRVVLDTDLILVSLHDPDVERTGDDRVGLIYKLVDSATGEETDVTPANLTETTPWPGCGTPPVFWSDRYGLTIMIYEPETRQVVVWQGKEMLEEVQRTPPVIACGEAFINDHYTRVEVTGDGAVLAFNWETGVLEESSRHAALGTEIVKALDPLWDMPVRIALSQDVAVLKLQENGILYTIVGSDGSHLDIVREKDLEPDERPEPALTHAEKEVISHWKELGDAEREAVAGDLLLGYQRKEGQELPPVIVHRLSFISPVNDTHIGIMDQRYRRLVVIGFADAE